MPNLKSGVTLVGTHPVWTMQCWGQTTGLYSRYEWSPDDRMRDEWWPVGPPGGALGIIDRRTTVFTGKLTMTKRRPAVVTSARDGAHGDGSDHPEGWALDLRTGDIVKPSTRQAYAAYLKKGLTEAYGDWWYCEYEPIPRGVGHVHVSFRPPWWNRATIPPDPF